MGYVYLIGTPIFRWYKIGKSLTPEVRVKNLGILLPFKIDVIAVWKAENHSKMEQALHEMYSDNRINGEWFEFSKDDVTKLVSRIPKEVMVYPGDFNEHFDSFSNIVQDTRSNRRILGVRAQKLRGDFTPEEREARRIASMEQQKLKKLQKNLSAVDK